MSKTKPYANIELLLRHWRHLQAFAKNRELNTSFGELRRLMSKPYHHPETEAEAVSRMRDETVRILEHISAQLAAWTANDSQSGLLRQKLIQGLYLEQKRVTLKEMSEREGVPIQRLSAELAKAKGELSARVFGSDGLVRNR
jgi:hypothetical protein